MNKIICGNNVDVMKTLPDESVDFIVTSPPYDDMRDYNGYTLDLHGVGEQAHRILKDGGMAVVVIQDATKNFGKTLTSFRMILDWCDSFSFKLFETCIYYRQGVEGAWWTKRFRVDHEYMPIFLKGKRPQYFDKEELKIPCKHAGKTMTGAAVRNKNGTTKKARKINIRPTKCRGTIWDINLYGAEGNKLKRKHPAVFPDILAYDMIECFCPEGGVVLDPFNGSGTSCVAAKSLNRQYIGIDVSEEYCELAEQRLAVDVISRKVVDIVKPDKVEIFEKTDFF